MLTFAKNDLSPLKTINWKWDGKFAITKENFDPYIARLRKPAWKDGPVTTGKILYFIKDGPLAPEDLAVVREHLDMGTVCFVNDRQYNDSDLKFIYEMDRMYDRHLAAFQDADILAEIEEMTADGVVA